MARAAVYGRWLRDRPIAVQVGGGVFMHAGPPPESTASSPSSTPRPSSEIDRFDRFLQRLVDAQLARPWFRFEDTLAVAAAEVRWTAAILSDAKAKGETPNLEGIDVALVKEANDILQIGSWSLLAGEGPLWYRGYATADDAVLQAPLAALLGRWKASRLVVGHTPTARLRGSAPVSGRVFLIDTGMLATVYKGTASALEIVGDRVSALYPDGTRTPLVPPATP